MDSLLFKAGGWMGLALLALVAAALGCATLPVGAQYQYENLPRLGEAAGDPLLEQLRERARQLDAEHDAPGEDRQADAGGELGVVDDAGEAALGERADVVEGQGRVVVGVDELLRVGAAGLDELACPSESAEARLDAREGLARVVASTERDDLAAVLLVRRDGLTQPEAAEELGISERTLRRKLTRFDGVVRKHRLAARSIAALVVVLLAIVSTRSCAAAERERHLDVTEGAR